MAQLKSAIDELQDLLDRSTAQYTKLMNRLAAAVFDSDLEAQRIITEQLSRTINESQALADLIGRKRMLMEADKLRKREQPLTIPIPALSFANPVVPHVPFLEAIQDLLLREPRLAEGWKQAQQVYVREHGFVLARSSSEKVTAKVRDIIIRALKTGKTVDKAAQLIAEIGGWSRAYGETVFRTNVTSAYTAGRFKQASDPEVQDVIGALEYQAVLDSDVRPNHRAADGLIGTIDDPGWEKIAPPGGWNCRCALRLVDKFELKRRRLLPVPRMRIPSSAHRDKGFIGGRPDIELYGL